MDRRTQTLATASQLISNERKIEYGDAKDGFNMIATMWSAYLGCVVTPYQVAIMMSLLKACRTRASPHKQDSYDDMCGYAALAAELAIGEKADEDKV